jgi:hypothetical protein
VTGETLSTDSYIENDSKSADFCLNGRDVQLTQVRDKTLEAALSKAKQ